MKEKISIIVPVYNVEKYIDKCLNSLVNQTLKEIEIIVVNDGTKDNSQKIIDRYAKKYKKVKSYIKENGGLSSARNYGLEKAKGEYIAFVDSDDYVELNMYEEMYKKAKENDYDIVVCDTELIYDSNYTKVVNSRYNLSNIDYIDYFLSAPMACNKIYSKKLFEGGLRFKLDMFYEDLELIPSLSLYTNKVAYLDKNFYKYYQRQGSIMKQKAFNTKINDIFIVLNSIEERVKENNKFEEYFEELEYLNIEHLLYSASLRYSEFKEGKNYIDKIAKLFILKYPNWRKNKYYLKKSKKFKTVCNLAYKKCYNILRVINKVKK